MIQFTKEQVNDFRCRGDSLTSVINWLLKETKTIREHELVIPHTGCATWQLYYYCPDCSVRLEFDIDSPKAYRCPLCHKHWSGEPYEGAWWRWLNTFNYTGTYHLSLLYLLTGDKQYADRAKEIITTYATYYPDYEVHGDIPYNKPGRANSQVLDEAIMLRYYAFSYDLIEDVLTESDRKLIKENLFRIGADHLRLYRTDQLHNHEVDVDSAMAVLGIILDDEELTRHALYGKYGLYYQLEKGMLEDGFWFECSSAYHYFSLMNFFMFEKFAIHTKWSNINHPNYRKMVLYETKLLKSNCKLTLLNDCMLHLASPDEYEVYEFAYAMFGDDDMLLILQDKYKDKPRDNIEAFLYGVKELPSKPLKIPSDDYHNENGSGITALHRSGDQFLLIKHGPYGGEHDHYDKLSFSYTREAKPVSEDLGTTGYGAHLHYSYYKNSISHNTVVLNEANQAPACGKVNRYERHADYCLLDAEVCWTREYKGPDSFIIKQWDDEAYEGARFRRQLVFADDFILDVETIKCPANRKIDNSLHFGGKLVETFMDESGFIRELSTLSENAPYVHFENCKEYSANNTVHAKYLIDDVVTDVYAKGTGGTVVFAEAPSNPSTEKIPYIIERTAGKGAVFAHVFASRKVDNIPAVSDVFFIENNNELRIEFELYGKKKEFSFSLT